MIPSVRETQKKYGSRAMAIAILFGFVFVLIGNKPVGKGLILGAIFSVINFVLMGETLPFSIGQSKRRAFTISIGSIVFRYALLAVPVIISISFSQINLASTVVGIFLIQLLILADHFYGYLTGSKQTE